MSKEDDLELHVEEVNEILSSTPKWILRWGITLILIMISTGVVLLNFIKYPDILVAEIKLTTINPPITLVSKSTGKLSELFVKNNQFVQKNDPIALIENTADYYDITYLEKLSIDLSNGLNLSDTIPNINLKDDLKVGELTPEYLVLLRSIKDLYLYIKINSFKRRIELLQKDVISFKELLLKYKIQETINNEKLSLVKKDYNRDKSLYETEVISTREYEAKKKDYLIALNENETIKIAVSNALIQINAIEKNILQFQIEDYQELTKLKSDLQQSLRSVIVEIKKWKNLYLIHSPIEGYVSFFTVWTTNQNILIGDELFSVIPSHKLEYVGKCILPALNTGKLQTGQKVNIKLDNYPSVENGILEGIVSNISKVPTKTNYSIDVRLRNGLITTYKKKLDYKEEMVGKAEIITNNLTVMDRVFFNFKKLISVN